MFARLVSGQSLVRGKVFALALIAAQAWAAVCDAEPASVPPASIVELYAPPCIERPYDRASLIALLRVELGGLGVTDVAIGDPGSGGTVPTDRLLASVVLTPATCDAAAVEVTLQVLDRASSKKVERRMMIGDVEFAGRPRALAIAIAELLQASWAELALAAVSPPGVPLPPALRSMLAARIAASAEGTRADDRRQLKAAFEAHDLLDAEMAEEQMKRQKSALLELSAVVQDFPSRSTALLGAEAALRQRFGNYGSWHVGIGAGFGDSDAGTGTVTVGAVTGSLGVAATTGGSIELELGPRLDVGYGWATGTGNSPDVAGKSYGNAVVLGFLESTLRVHTESPWTLLAGVGVGHSLSDVSFLSDTARAAGIGGVAVDVRVGAGARL